MTNKEKITKLKEAIEGAEKYPLTFFEKHTTIQVMQDLVCALEKLEAQKPKVFSDEGLDKLAVEHCDSPLESEYKYGFTIGFKTGFKEASRLNSVAAIESVFPSRYEADLYTYGSKPSYAQGFLDCRNWLLSHIKGRL